MMSIILPSIIIALLSYLFLWYRKCLNYWPDQGIACEKPHWSYGSFKGLQTDFSMSDLCLNYYRKFKGTGPFAGFYFGPKPSVFVLDVKLVEQILVKDFSNFTDRGFYHNEEDDPLSAHLFFLDGLQWRNMRNKLSPTFTSSKLKHMFPIIIKMTKDFTKELGRQIEEDKSRWEIKELMSDLMVDIIGACAFGLECNSLKNPQNNFRLMGTKANTEQRHGPLMVALMQSFPKLARKLHLKLIPDDVEKFYVDLVRETVEYREKNNVRRNDFLDTLIDLKNQKLIKSEHGDELTNLTLNQMAAQAFVFLVAGFDTSSTTASLALYELALNEGIQEKVRQEIVQGLENNNNEFSYESVKDMVYLNQVISEILRLHSVFPLLGRRALNDYTVPGHPKYVIKKGMNVTISLAGIHRDPDYYPNPDNFNPDNFAPDLVAQRDPCLWLPFGAGPRNCIGMRFAVIQTVLGLAMLLKDFKFSVCNETPIPVKFNKQSFLLTSEKGLYLKVEKL